jgi:hypothetical protein
MFVVTFIYVYLEVINFTLAFAYHHYGKPIMYGVCYMDVGYHNMFIAGGSFDC